MLAARVSTRYQFSLPPAAPSLRRVPSSWHLSVCSIRQCEIKALLLEFPVLAVVLGSTRRPSLWAGTIIASVGTFLDVLSGLMVIAFRRLADSCHKGRPCSDVSAQS